MHKAFKYRIYPNKSQKVLLSKTFGCIRVIWNANYNGVVIIMFYYKISNYGK